MKRIFICALAFIVGMSNSVEAQILTRQDLRGTRHVGPAQVGPTSADFAIGMSLDGGSSYVNTASVNDAVVISGLILPEPVHFGQTADIFVVTRVNQGNFQMLNSNGGYVDWNGEVGLLAPYLVNQVLTPEMTIEIFSGQLSVEANHLLFIGYLPAGGTLHYSDIAAELIVTAASGRDEAMEFFASSISNDIVHTNCIACHISNGPYAGRNIHEFALPNNAEHLSINFAVFENLVVNKGRTYILEKVINPNPTIHPGGGMILPGTAEYTNLDTFLSLLENL